MGRIKILILLSTFISILFLFSQTQIISASEGIIELRSLTQEKYRCFASSIRMQNLRYKILFSCRNLIYPAGDALFYYVMWAQPSELDKNPIRLGLLGIGMGEFEINTSFSSLFITIESNANPRNPTGLLIMRGSVTPIHFLEEKETISPTAIQEEPIQERVETPKILSTREKLTLALKRAGVASILAFISLVGLILVITRVKG